MQSSDKDIDTAMQGHICAAVLIRASESYKTAAGLMQKNNLTQHFKTLRYGK